MLMISLSMFDVACVAVCCWALCHALVFCANRAIKNYLEANEVRMCLPLENYIMHHRLAVLQAFLTVGIVLAVWMIMAYNSQSEMPGLLSYLLSVVGSACGSILIVFIETLWSVNKSEGELLDFLERRFTIKEVNGKYVTVEAMPQSLESWTLNLTAFEALGRKLALQAVISNNSGVITTNN